jgi:regulator of cell morphogenesis and NO signaling
MLLSSEKTVSKMAVENPAVARVFEKHGIDYCCGGKNSLETACKERGIALESLLGELAASKPELEEHDWKTVSLRDLTTHIVTRHHAYLKSELPRIAALFAKVLRAHGEREPRLAEVSEVFEVLKEELEAHLMKEEMILFPAIVRIETGSSAGVPCSIEQPIARMEYEHESAGRALAQMRHLTLDYYISDEACNTYRALFAALIELEGDLHQHIHLENNILFPRAAALQGR